MTDKSGLKVGAPIMYKTTKSFQFKNSENHIITSIIYNTLHMSLLNVKNVNWLQTDDPVFFLAKFGIH